MVVAGILALALALPTGALFGIGYGTGVRIGYEQIYPLLFPADDKGSRQPATAVKNVKALNDIYNAIGGKEASQMGIAVGLSSAMSELNNNPDFQDLLELESKLSGLTPSNSENRTRYGLDNLSDSGSSSDPPASFLNNPIITDYEPEHFTNQGPPEVHNNYGFAPMTKTELLNNQPNVGASDYALKRQNWEYYYNRILTSQTASARQADDLRLAEERRNLTKNEAYKAQETYVVKRAEILTRILNLQFDLEKLATSAKSNVRVSYVTIIASKENLLANTKSELVKHITLARNIGHTKALANTDWNNRIWKI